MKLQTYLTLAAFLLVLFPVGAFAAKKSSDLTIYDTVTLAHTTLAPGDYKVEWSGSGPQVQVQFLKENKPVASTSAKLVNKPSPYDGPALVTVPSKNGARRVTEVEFSKFALVFQPSSSPSRSMP